MSGTGGAVIGSVLGGPLGTIGGHFIGSAIGDKKAQERRDAINKHNADQFAANTSTDDKGYLDFGGKMLAGTQGNLSLLERAQTSGLNKQIQLGAPGHAQSDRIRARGADIHRRRDVTPGRRQSMLRDVVSTMSGIKARAAKQAVLARQEKQRAEAEANKMGMENE